MTMAGVYLVADKTKHSLRIAEEHATPDGADGDKGPLAGHIITIGRLYELQNLLILDTRAMVNELLVVHDFHIDTVQRRP